MSFSPRARSVLKVAIFIVVFGVVTFTGMLFAAAAEHGPDWYKYISYLLIFPIVVVNALFQIISHEHYLSSLRANIALFVGLLGQLAYCYALVSLAGKVVSPGLRRSVPGSRSRR